MDVRSRAVLTSREVTRRSRLAVAARQEKNAAREKSFRDAQPIELCSLGISAGDADSSRVEMCLDPIAGG